MFVCSGYRQDNSSARQQTSSARCKRLLRPLFAADDRQQNFQDGGAAQDTRTDLESGVYLAVSSRPCLSLLCLLLFGVLLIVVVDGYRDVPMDEILHVQAYDADSLKDDKMGDVSISLKQMMNEGKTQSAHRWTHTATFFLKQWPEASIILRFEFQNLSDVPLPGYLRAVAKTPGKKSDKTPGKHQRTPSGQSAASLPALPLAFPMPAPAPATVAFPGSGESKDGKEAKPPSKLPPLSAAASASASASGAAKDKEKDSEKEKHDDPDLALARALADAGGLASMSMVESQSVSAKDAPAEQPVSVTATEHAVSMLPMAMKANISGESVSAVSASGTGTQSGSGSATPATAATSATSAASAASTGGVKTASPTTASAAAPPTVV